MGRPKAPLLSPAGVVDAALALIDRDGYAALNMRALGRELGVSDASLYYHFTNKDEILLAVAQRIMLNVHLPPQFDPWDEVLIESATGYRRVMLEHPNAVAVILEYQPRILIMPGVYDGIAATMEASGLPAEIVLTILDALESLVLGSTLQSTSISSRQNEVTVNPAVDAAAKSARWNEEERFARACRALIDGLIATVDTPADPPRRAGRTFAARSSAAG